MISIRNRLLILAGSVFVAGSGYVVYVERPVMKLSDKDNAAAVVDAAPKPQAPVAAKGDDDEREDEDEDKDEDEDEAGSGTAPSPITEPASAGSTIPVAGTYTLTDVQAHGLESSCWTAINGSVYELTEWIGRHPGGAQRIIGLCGIDGTEAFTRKHGRSKAAQSALGLLKIGTIK